MTPAPLECVGCHKSFYTASPDAIVSTGATCNHCGGAVIHAGLDELVAA